MNASFDAVLSRRGTGSCRWDTVDRQYGEPDLIPLTVADMDFPAAPPIREALARTVEHGIFGYTMATGSYCAAVQARFAQRWHWDIQPAWIQHSPGVVNAVACCIQGMTEPGDEIVLPVPMYHPFAPLVADNGRTVLRTPLRRAGDRCTLDFGDLERLLARPQARMLIFCNPHNPIGLAWTREELRQVCALCLKHGVILISDEIHCDFVFSGHAFCSAAGPMAELGGLDRLVVCSSASKSFNLAGLQTSQIIIPGEALRAQYRHIQALQHTGSPNLMGLAATEAAYRFCGGWQAELLAYLEANRDFAVEFLRTRTPALRPVVPEATYLLWIDCRELGLDGGALADFFIHRAKVGVNPGASFGPGGEGHVRLNFAAPRPILEEALLRIERAVSERLSQYHRERTDPT